MADAVQYDHTQNLHTLDGARAGLEYLRETLSFKSVLDVGAGTGSWLRAAIDAGVVDVAGLDGVSPAGRDLAVEADLISVVDLERPFELGRKFDLALCLEVAEHLEEAAAQPLISSLCRHADQVAFSAACPGQNGQHHVNCRWPEYWQEHFNRHGFACSDGIRLAMWSDRRIEPWYRQNMFIARKDLEQAGREPRLRAIIHPEMTRHIHALETPEGANLRGVFAGHWSPRLYLRLLARSVANRYARRADARFM